MKGLIWTFIIFFILPAVIGWLRAANKTEPGPRRGTEPTKPATPPKGAKPKTSSRTPPPRPDRLTIRFVDTRLGEDEDGPFVKEVQAYGPLPIRRPVRAGFMTSVLDSTEDELQPVISAFEMFQEPETTVYQGRVEIGLARPGQGFTDWSRVGMVLPEILEPPYGGKRELTAIVRLIDLDNVPDVTHGFHEADQPGLLWQDDLTFSWTFKEKGYREAAAHREEGTAIAIRMAVAVAMADGSLERREGAILKAWIERRVHHLSAPSQERLKQTYNQAMRTAYLDAKAGNLDLNGLTTRLNELDETSIKYEAVELCYDVMAGDGVATPDEVRLINGLTASLNLNVEDVAKLRDKKLLGLDKSLGGHASIEEMVGIQPEWDSEQIRRHLRVEFQKWNNRLNQLKDPAERANAQEMLDVIAEARRKYV